MDRTQRTQDFGDDIPALREFSRAAQELFDSQDACSLFACRGALEHLLTTDWLKRLVSIGLDSLAASPEASLGGLSERRMTLVSADRWALNLILVLPEPSTTAAPLFSSPRHALLGVMGPAAMEIRRYFQPRPFPADVLDRARRLEDRGAQTVQVGQTATVLAGHDVIGMRAPKHPTVLLMLETGENATTPWRYDASTLLPQAVVTAPGAASRLAFAASVLARLGDARCTPSLQRLFGHPDHVVRWAAVRALMRLDRTAGMQVLEAAAQDLHPHVREAAQAALARLGAGPQPTLAAAV